MYLNFSEINPVTRIIVYMCRVWKPSSQVTGRQGDNYHLRYHWHAAVPALPLQHRRYLCQELQVDIRQIMFVSGLLRGSVATPICSPPTDGASACRVSWRLHGESWLEGKYKAQTDYPFLSLKMEATGCPETSVSIYHYWIRNSPEEHSYVSWNYSWKFRDPWLQIRILLDFWKYFLQFFVFLFPGLTETCSELRIVKTGTMGQCLELGKRRHMGLEIIIQFPVSWFMALNRYCYISNVGVTEQGVKETGNVYRILGGNSHANIEILSEMSSSVLR